MPVPCLSCSSLGRHTPSGCCPVLALGRTRAWAMGHTLRGADHGLRGQPIRNDFRRRSDDVGTVFELKAPLSANMNDHLQHRFRQSSGRPMDFERGPAQEQIMAGPAFCIARPKGAAAAAAARCSQETVFDLPSHTAGIPRTTVLQGIQTRPRNDSPLRSLITDSSADLYGTPAAARHAPNGTARCSS